LPVKGNSADPLFCFITTLNNRAIEKSPAFSRCPHQQEKAGIH
jgi:hypothetical protein